MNAAQHIHFAGRAGMGILAFLSLLACRPQRPQLHNDGEAVKAAGGVSAKHKAASKAEPAKGSVAAAKSLADKPSTGKPSTGKPAAGKSAAEKSAVGPSAAGSDTQKKSGFVLSSKQAQAIKSCNDLVTQICKDLGPEHLGCRLSGEKLPKIGDRECQGLVSRYSALVADLQKRAAVKKDASREQMAKMSAPERAPGFGSKAAPVQIVEFLDFECSACARLSPVIAELRTKAQKGGPLSGKVAYTARMFPLEKLHPRANLAAKAALLAHEQGRYWEYHDALFADAMVAVGLERDDLVRAAQQTGLDAKRFASQLDTAKTQAALNEHKKLGDDVTVLATPTLFINGKRVAVYEFQERLDEALEQLDASVPEKP